ncbi:hypothetical protein QWZ08_14540 [Ferruginibacter paludis]|uniref:hypothetical protein n=1 Tax=Ferruginibacter paludis TaxID=1310417 RepID=UPI0025B4183D|nr:hypothetical protein [Ferruginibacter paludis]MDN3656862.1 hypothetical protein [Ferruginibacter paludis]
MELIIDFGYRERKQNEWNLKDQAHYVALYNTIIMNICSYLDEYDDKFTTNPEPQFKSRILEVKKIAKPAYKQIRRWKHLNDYRNNMIAHNFRIDGKEFSFNLLGQYNAPRTYRDLALIRKHLVMIHTIIEAEFEDVMQNINPFIKSFPVKEQEISYEAIEEELNSLISEINQLCIDNGKVYQLRSDIFMKL